MKIGEVRVAEDSDFALLKVNKPLSFIFQVQDSFKIILNIFNVSWIKYKFWTSVPTKAIKLFRKMTFLQLN